ncbi:MAG: quinoprotein relay system zinc metallohydrolase 1 [Geminicoccaceae bacterium]
MTLSRRQAGAGLVGTGLAGAAGPSKVWAEPRLNYGLEPRQVAQGLWMVEGLTEYFSFQNGGNIVNIFFAETDEGAVLFDTGPSLRYAEELRLTMTAVMPSGIAAVYNTHHHPDHFFGNQVFTDRPLRALPATQSLAREQGDDFADNMYRLVGDWMRGTEPVPPEEPVQGGLFSVGGREFEAFPLEGHTSADLAILDRETGVLIAGDLAFLDRAPTTPHADLAVWQKSLDALAAVEAAAIAPGHGPFDPAGDSLRQTRAYLEWLDDTLRQAAEQGLDMVEAMNLPMPEAFAAMGAQPQEYHRSIAHLFPDYELAALPRID